MAKDMFKYVQSIFLRMNVTVVLEKQTEGGFTAHVPSLPGCISQGETRKEALENIKEAIELYLEEEGDASGERVVISV